MVSPEGLNYKYFESSFHNGTVIPIAEELVLQLSSMDFYQAHSSLSDVVTLVT